MPFPFPSKGSRVRVPQSAPLLPLTSAEPSEKSQGHRLVGAFAPSTENPRVTPCYPVKVATLGATSIITRAPWAGSPGDLRRAASYDATHPVLGGASPRRSPAGRSRPLPLFSYGSPRPRLTRTREVRAGGFPTLGGSSLLLSPQPIEKIEELDGSLTLTGPSAQGQIPPTTKHHQGGFPRKGKKIFSGRFPQIPRNPLNSQPSTVVF